MEPGTSDLHDPHAWTWTDLGDGRGSLRCSDPELFAAIDAGVLPWPTATEIAAAFGFSVDFIDGGDDVTYFGGTMIDIENLTLKQIRELKSLLSLLPGLEDRDPRPAPYYPLPLGSIVCVQTVTLWYVGTLREVTPTDFVLMDAAWAADTGRFSIFASTGDAGEVEPFPDGVPVVVTRGSVIAVAPHPKQLRVVK